MSYIQSVHRLTIAGIFVPGSRGTSNADRTGDGLVDNSDGVPLTLFGRAMIQRQLKLRLTVCQERQLEEWLWHLTGVWNWALRKIELDARDGIYRSAYDLDALIVGHGSKIDIAGHVLKAVVVDAHRAWGRCFKRLDRKPRLKGARNRLNSIPFPDSIRTPEGHRVRLPKIGSIRFHKQDIPEGKIKSGRVVRRASGWYLCLFIDAEPNVIPKTGNGAIGIDPGFKHLLTLSTGEKIEHPRELERTAERLAQAQRGGDKRLAARLQERMANQRKDRNHKLSRRLVGENAVIVWSKDSHRGLARIFGKSVASSGHGQLRQMLSYKCLCGGREFVEVPSKNTTRTCSSCGALSGPAGWTGLSVREWTCACGAHHDRDCNAAVNVLLAGLGQSHELRREAVSEIAD